MSPAERVSDLVAADGYYVVSEGTLHPRDLLPRFLDALRLAHPEAYSQAMMPACGFPIIPAHAEEDPYAEWWETEGALLVDCLLDDLDACAPEGYHFGAHEDDGACFGFFPSGAS